MGRTKRDNAVITPHYTWGAYPTWTDGRCLGCSILYDSSIFRAICSRPKAVAREFTLGKACDGVVAGGPARQKSVAISTIRQAGRPATTRNRNLYVRIPFTTLAGSTPVSR